MFFCSSCCGPQCYIPPIEGTSDEFRQIVVEITDSTTIMNQGEGTDYEIRPVEGWCCPCVDGQWFLDYSDSCSWAGGYQYDPFGSTGNVALPPGCTEPYPQFCESFGGACYVANSGFVSLSMQISKLSPTEIVFGLTVQNYHHQSGSGYICTGQLSASAVLPAPPDGEYLDIAEWTVMTATDDRPFGLNSYCAWREWEDSDGVMQPAIATVRFKGAS